MLVANKKQQQQQQLLNIEIFEEKEGDELINLRTRLMPASISIISGRERPAKIFGRALFYLSIIQVTGHIVNATHDNARIS